MALNRFFLTINFKNCFLFFLLMDGFDLRKYQNEEGEKDKIKSVMGKILSGREGYESIIETKKEEVRCKGCNWLLEGGEKFCPECGNKVD